MDRVIIAAYGLSSKWPLPLPKHLTVIDGETLLYRTIEQSSKYTGDIWISSLPDERYRHKLAKNFVPEPTSNIDSIGFLLDNMPLWNKNGRTILLLGDTYFTDPAMKTIMTDDSKSLMTYGRFGPSNLFGKYGEAFAHSFWPDQHDQLLKAILDSIEDFRKGYFRCLGWEVQAKFEETPRGDWKKFKLWKTIDDWTDDFDKPAELENWLEARKRKKL